MSQNLNSEEREKWKETCKRQRDIARCNPAYDPRMVWLDDYTTTLGPWVIRLTLDTYLKPPMWHGSISLFKDIGDETVYGKDGKPIFEVPKQGMLAVESWSHEDYDNARDLLGDIFGPLINHPDQKVIEGHAAEGMVLQWLTTNKDANQRIELVRI